MHIAITRHFATLGQRQVFYLRAGAGPPVLLLHQSPLSSREMLPLLRKLAPTHTVLAPDMPGYGASDPFSEAQVTMAMLVDNVAAWLDAVGIEAAAIYGFHTGASIATAFARRYPRRVVVAIADGLLCLDEAERRDWLTHYMHPFLPSWDGSHLSWLWSRLKDQSVFFPWYQRSAAARLDVDGALPAALAVTARDWLRSGDCYRRGYQAAMAYDPRVDLPAITTPHYVVCKRHDPLWSHLARLPADTQVVSQTHADADATETAVMTILQRFHHRPAAPAAVAPTPLSQRPWRDFVRVDGQQLQITRAGPGQGEDKGHAPLTVLQHDAQSSLRACEDFIGGLAQQRAVLAIELPGHGDTEGVAADRGPSIRSLAELLDDALTVMGVETCDLIGVGAGAAIQTELQCLRARARSLTLINAIDITAEPALQAALLASYRPLEPDAYGGYLLRAWHEARDHLLFFPWYERRRAAAVNDTPLLDAELLQRYTVDLLLSGDSGIAVRHAELMYPLHERLRSVPLTPRFAAPRWQPRTVLTQQLAEQSAAPFIELPRQWAQWGGVL